MKKNTTLQKTIRSAAATSLIGLAYGSQALATSATTSVLNSANSIATSTGLGTETSETAVYDLISIVLGSVGVIMLLLIIYGGILIMTSGVSGKGSEGIDKGKTVIQWAIIGSIITFFSLTIVSWIDNNVI